MEVVEFLLDRLCDKKKARQRGQPGSGNERRFIFSDFRTKLRGGGGRGGKTDISRPTPWFRNEPGKLQATSREIKQENERVND